jgi:hypothetical protein
MNLSTIEQIDNYTKDLASGAGLEWSQGFGYGVVSQILETLANDLPEVKAYLEWMGAIKKEEDAA